ncbi:TetR/AcrR family transcriptional regulator [Mycobacterium ahvazicum]|uniref:TetR/AcrR family transcriptional regulator n=1 Tax=Mycobacterium ahvazicum TaxID=1964395 RepID=A0A2K4Y770_9MYCO|nr:TetR/AcrR family transcriptional regulator [Mycobacterium ahvazicum]SOX52645.1 TetR/AcrR family transcriptional regulator [Mycobacterium ahvazicum]
MRTHGWSGSTPASDEEAIERILDAAAEAIDERGTSMRVADVARKLGVSRQTVYNYYPGSNTLERAVAERSGIRFLQQLTDHLAGTTDPVDALVESLAYTLEWLPDDKPFQLMLAHDPSRTSAGMMSDQAKQFGHAVLEKFEIDWTAIGFDDRAIDDLVEYMLRMLQSFMLNPGQPPRKGKALRSYLRRWVAPVLDSELASHRR